MTDGLKRSHRTSESMRVKSAYVDYDFLIKVVIVGDTGVGKSQLVARFTRNVFATNSRQTIGVEFATKTVRVDNKNVCAQLWDTAGEERYRALASAYYRGAVGVLLVFDVTNPRSFKNLAHWLSEVKAYTLPTCQIILVGNKIDLRKTRKVSEAQAKSFAQSNGMKYLEASALDCTNVDASFTSLVAGIYWKTLCNKSNKAAADSTVTENNGELKVKDDETTTTDKLRSKCCSVD